MAVSWSIIFTGMSVSEVVGGVTRIYRYIDIDVKPGKYHTDRTKIIIKIIQKFRKVRILYTPLEYLRP